MALTIKEIEEAISMLRAGLWPSSMGPPPDAWGGDPERQQQIARRVLADLQQVMDSEGGPDGVHHADTINILRGNQRA
jgi:hypothetical protein